MIMTKEELKEYLPHRDPMLLVDEMYMDDEGVCHAKYHVKENEYFCSGHFPGNPIMPGVLQVEALAQTACFVAFSRLSEEERKLSDLTIKEEK